VQVSYECSWSRRGPLRDQGRGESWGRVWWRRYRTTPSPRTLEVESVPVVWSETTATSACVGEVEAIGLFTRRHLSGLDMGYPGWRQVWKRPIYTVVLRAIASVKRNAAVHAWFNSEGHRCGRRLIRAVSFRFENGSVFSCGCGVVSCWVQPGLEETARWRTRS
jgi:hypothetical protein